MLLTQRANHLSALSAGLDLIEIYCRQWKQVQCLSDSFWRRWRQEYLATLQSRIKWPADHPSLQIRDIVLLKDSQVKRNEWPLGLVVNMFPCQDNRVRKVEVRVVQGGSPREYLRSISDLVLLLKG